MASGSVVRIREAPVSREGTLARVAVDLFGGTHLPNSIKVVESQGEYLNNALSAIRRGSRPDDDETALRAIASCLPPFAAICTTKGRIRELPPDYPTAIAIASSVGWDTKPLEELRRRPVYDVSMNDCLRAVIAMMRI